MVKTYTQLNINKGTAIPKNIDHRQMDGKSIYSNMIKGTAISKNTYHRQIDGKSEYALSRIKVQPLIKIHIIDKQMVKVNMLHHE